MIHVGFWFHVHLYSTYVVSSIFIVFLTNNTGKKTAALCVLRTARGLAVGVYCPLSFLPSSMIFPIQPPATNHSTKNNKKQRPNPHQEGGLVEEASQKQR